MKWSRARATAVTSAGARLAAAALATVVLGACLHADPAWYPLDASSWWVFGVQSRVLDEPREARFVARNLGQRGGYFYQAYQGRGLARLEVVGDGLVRQVAGGAARPQSNQARLAHTVLPQRIAAGSRWTVDSTLRVIESRTFARQDRVIVRRYPVTIEKTVTATDASVDTPAGHFDGCLLISGRGTTYVRTDRGNSSAEVTVRTREWFAPGRGPVRAQRHETSDSTFLISGQETWELLDFGG